MKKYLLLILLLIILLSFFNCQRVDAGYVGIKVYLLGAKKGVDKEVLGVGRYWIGINEQLYKYETFTKTYPFTQSKDEGSPIDEAFYFQSKEGVKCNVDISVQAKVDSEKVSILFQTYRQELEGIIKTFMKNDLRNSIIRYGSSMTIEDLYTAKKIDMINSVTKDMIALYSEKGIIIDNISYLSDIRFPEEVQKSIVAKIEATQKAMQSENELRAAEAEAKKKIASAEGEYRSNLLRSQSLTPQLLEYEKIMNQRQAISKWNGQLPVTTLGSNTVPFIELK